MTDYDDSAHKSAGTTRRRFLGAATIAAALPVSMGNASASEQEDNTPPSDGTDQPLDGIEPGGPTTLFAAINRHDHWEDGMEYEVDGPFYDDEKVDVAVDIPLPHGNVHLSFTEAEAKAFTHQLLATARRSADE